MISRRAFFSFLAGGAALVGLPTAFLLRRIWLCDLAFAFRNCNLRGGELLTTQTSLSDAFGPLIDESPTVGWKTWVNGEKYGNLITIDGIPTEEEATKITEVLQYDLDRFHRRIALLA